MQVVLLQKVPKLGQKDDVVKVKEGFAMNFLIPGKKAIVATVSALWEAEKRRAHRVVKVEAMIKNAHDIAAKLKGATLTFKRKAEGDKLFGSVSEKDIVEAIKADFKIELNKEMVELKEHLKTVGSHPLAIRLTPDIATPVTVLIHSE